MAYWHGRWSGFFVKELKSIWRGGFPDQASTAVTCFGCCCMQARGEAVRAKESWDLGCRSTSATHTSDVHPSWTLFGWAGDWFGGTATWGLSAASPWCHHQWIGTLILMNLSSCFLRKSECPQEEMFTLSPEHFLRGQNISFCHQKAKQRLVLATRLFSWNLWHIQRWSRWGETLQRFYGGFRCCFH